MSDYRLYEVHGSAIFVSRLDDGVVQDVITALTQVLMAYGAGQPSIEVRQVFFADGKGFHFPPRVTLEDRGAIT